MAGDVYRKAYEFWDKPEIVSTGRQPSTPSREFISIRSGHVVLEALKRAEDGRGVIARVYSVSSERNQAIISLWKNFTATEVNILEEAVGNHEIKAHGSVQLELQPFEVKTLKLELDRQAS
ncbi:MAG: glycosyl hydrolase-related protein [Desulfurococcus sp.]|nr:glycosyl hydrolase-related protein [Desulfurococcus sp.]